MKKTLQIQTDLEFQQNETKKLSKKYYVDMFSIRLRGCKVFAAEQKVRELKRLLLKIKTRYKREKTTINPCKLAEKKLNIVKSKRKFYTDKFAFYDVVRKFAISKFTFPTNYLF